MTWDLGDIAKFLLVTVSPISELRGGIPLGIALGLDPWFTFSAGIVANTVIFFPIFFVLRLFYDRLLFRIPLFGRYLDRLRRRGKPIVEKYGFWGLFVFVAVPLPLSGAYTGTILAWLLDVEWKKAFPAVALGVVVAGVIVFLITMGVISI